MMHIRAFISALCVLATACNSPNRQLQLTGHALFFRSGGIKFYQNLDRTDVITISARQPVWPAEIREKFEDPQWDTCAVIMYRIEASGNYGNNNWFEATKIKVLSKISPRERRNVIKALNIEALDDAAVCSSSI